ncbi:MAG: transposase [Mariprofundaceae bacterium]
MARSLRLEYPGALYHITSRGNAQIDIFLSEEDREVFINLLQDEIQQQGWLCYAWCLMDNHYHFLIETPEANLSRGMQRLNGRYTQGFNRRHDRVGHVFQGRYKAILIEKESHLLELCRYIVLNPVRAGIVEDASQWKWSSYHQTVSCSQNEQWVVTAYILALFAAQVNLAIDKYRHFVAEGIKSDQPWDQLRGQIYLGGEDFLSKIEALLAEKKLDTAIPLAQRHPARPTSTQVLKDVARAFSIEIEQVLDRHTQRDAYRTAVFLLRRTCNMPLKEVANLAAISPARVSQIQSEVSHSQLPACLRNYKVKL